MLINICFSARDGHNGGKVQGINEINSFLEDGTNNNNKRIECGLWTETERETLVESDKPETFMCVRFQG